MAVQYAPQKLTVPDGFNNLLEGLAREVLREQPENIIKFAADYFKQQIATRAANGGSLPSQTQPMNDEKEKVASTPPPPAKEPTPPPKEPTPPPKEPTPPPQDIATDEVQSTDVDESANEQDSPRLTEEEAATKIQAMVRGKKARNDVEAMKASKSQTEETPQEVVTENESESANERNNTDTEAEEPVQSDAPPSESQAEETADGDGVEEATEEELTEAALKIQASFRGSKVRKELAAKKESENNLKTTEEVEDKKEEETKSVSAEEEGGN